MGKHSQFLYYVFYNWRTINVSLGINICFQGAENLPKLRKILIIVKDYSQSFEICEMDFSGSVVDGKHDQMCLPIYCHDLINDLIQDVVKVIFQSGKVCERPPDFSSSLVSPLSHLSLILVLYPKICVTRCFQLNR